MEQEIKKINLKVNLSMTEETMNALIAYRDNMGFPNLDDTVSSLLAAKLGKSSSPLWSDSEILAVHEGGKKILAALCKRAMTSKEIIQEAAINGGSLRAYLAHLSRRYKKLQKEPLHLWNENIEKYEVNPKYLETISRLLAG